MNQTVDRRVIRGHGAFVTCVTVLLVLSGEMAAQFPSQLVRQTGRIQLPSAVATLCEFGAYSECCGFELNGIEYAAVGCSHGVWIVEVTGGSPISQAAS